MIKYKIGEQLRINDVLYEVKITNVEQQEDCALIEIFLEEIKEKGKDTNVGEATTTHIPNCDEWIRVEEDFILGLSERLKELEKKECKNEKNEKPKRYVDVSPYDIDESLITKERMVHDFLFQQEIFDKSKKLNTNKEKK